MTQEELAKTVVALQRRIVVLESLVSRSNTRSRLPKGLAIAAIFLTFAVGGVVMAADGDCPNDMPFCFFSNSPARASEINHNFAQIKEWIEQKVGTVPSDDVGITGTLTTAGAVNMNGVLNVDSEINIPSATDVESASGGGLVITDTNGTMRLDGNEIDTTDEKLFLNVANNNTVRIGGALEVDEGLPISNHTSTTHSQSNGGAPETVDLGSTDRRICFLAGMSIHDSMENESQASCFVKYEGTQWILETEVDYGDGDPDVTCHARCFTF